MMFCLSFWFGSTQVSAGHITFQQMLKVKSVLAQLKYSNNARFSDNLNDRRSLQYTRFQRLSQMPVLR